MDKKTLDKLANILLIVGGVNWGLIGWLDYNLVEELFGPGSTAARVIYAVIGAAAVYVIYYMYLNTNGKRKRK